MPAGPSVWHDPGVACWSTRLGKRQVRGWTADIKHLTKVYRPHIGYPPQDGVAEGTVADNIARFLASLGPRW
jgi:ABC-type protease/lipase transport system fused ATPase/permease subunit